MRDRDENAYRIVDGLGPKMRPRSIAQRALTRRRLQRGMHDAVIELSDFLPKPLPEAWHDARRGKQKWWGNLARHIESVVDSPTPPEFQVMMKIAEVWAWFIWDCYADRGIAAPQPPCQQGGVGSPLAERGKCQRDIG